jgi:membrane protein DedA with SNARE-associated domain
MRDVTAAVSSWGYSSVFVLMLLESSSLPIPSEVVLPLAGYLVSLGQLNLWITIVVATTAGIAGSLVDYYIGLKGVHLLAEHRVLGKVFFTRSQLEVAVRWFNRYGSALVFLGRLVPGFRTIVSFPAGAVRMPLAKFVAFTTAGCLMWNGVLIYVGVFLGKRWREVAGVSHYLIIGAVAAVIVALTMLLVWRRKRCSGALHSGFASNVEK